MAVSGHRAGLGPGRLHHVPRGDLADAAQLGRTGVPQRHVLQRGRQGRALRGVGRAATLLRGDARLLPVTALDLVSDSATASRPGLIRSIVHRPAGDEAVALPVEGRLASFDGATAWLNSDPLTPEGLRGRVVVVDFWTYTCVNWLRTLPYLRAWAAKYHDDGLTVIGVHTPEFGFEGNIENVVAQSQRPRRGVSDRGRHRLRGLVRVREPLLAGALHRRPRRPDPVPPLRRGRVPDDRDGHPAVAVRWNATVPITISSWSSPTAWRWRPTGRHWHHPRRMSATARAPASRRKTPRVSTRPTSTRCRIGCSLNEWALSGTWTVAGHAAISNEPGGRIAFRFHARDVNLVMGPAAPGDVDPVPRVPRRSARNRRRTAPMWARTAAERSATSARTN